MRLNYFTLTKKIKLLFLILLFPLSNIFFWGIFIKKVTYSCFANMFFLLKGGPLDETASFLGICLILRYGHGLHHWT